MTRGPRKHLKRIAAPKTWMLSKMTGVYAPRLSPGPHSSTTSIPLLLLLRKLNIASTKKEIEYILKNNFIKINGVIRQDRKFPIGLFDVLSIIPTNTHYRLLYNINKKFYLHEITQQNSNIRIAKIVKKSLVDNIPIVYTKCGYNFKFANPDIQINDSVRINISENKIDNYLKFDLNKLAFVSGGSNLGSIGVICRIERKEIGHDIIYLVDKNGRNFATRIGNVIVIGEAFDKSWITMPKGDGVKISDLEESIKQFGEIVKDAEDYENEAIQA